jgi:hypothetical protein
LIDVGGQAGPVSGGANLAVGGVTVGDHHVAAGLVAVGLLVLVLLWKGKWRFSTTVG